MQNRENKNSPPLYLKNFAERSEEKVFKRHQWKIFQFFHQTSSITMWLCPKSNRKYYLTQWCLKNRGSTWMAKFQENLYFAILTPTGKIEFYVLLLGKKLLFISIVFLISGILCLVCCILSSGESGGFQNQVQFATNIGTTERFPSLYNSSKVHRRHKFDPQNTFSTYFGTGSLFGVM